MIEAISRRIGEIISAVYDGHFLARTHHAPRLGAQLYSSGGKLIGRVDDILGPVSSPLVLVRPLTDGLSPGVSLFVPVRKKQERRSRNG